jgi:hypothetical protein
MGKISTKRDSAVALNGTEKPFYCQTVEDFYTPVARRTIYRLMAQFLAQNRISATELLHRADMIGKLESAGLLLQHAIQKIAVERSEEDDTPVAETIGQLKKLTSRVSARVCDSKRNEAFADFRIEDFGALSASLCESVDGTYFLNVAICGYIRDIERWCNKIVCLIGLMEAVPPDRPSGRFAHAVIDELVSEIVQFSASCQDLVGTRNHFGDVVLTLIDLLDGIADTGDDARCSSLLAKHFSSEELPRARAGLAMRIVAEIRSSKSLYPDSAYEELRLFRQVAEKAMRTIGADMDRGTLMAALESRSQRYVAQDNMGDRLPPGATPDEKMEWLFFVGKCVAGEHNKTLMAEKAKHIIASARFINYFRSSQHPVVHRLQRLIALNADARNCDFPKTVRS